METLPPECSQCRPYAVQELPPSTNPESTCPSGFVIHDVRLLHATGNMCYNREESLHNRTTYKKALSLVNDFRGKALAGDFPRFVSCKKFMSIKVLYINKFTAHVCKMGSLLCLLGTCLLFLCRVLVYAVMNAASAVRTFTNLAWELAGFLRIPICCFKTAFFVGTGLQQSASWL